MDTMMLILIVGGAFVAWKSGMLNKLTGGMGSQESISTSNGETSYASTDGTNIDVSGENACACSNGVCKGNCSGSGMITQTGTGGMSPKEWVKSKVPQAYYAHRAYRSTWGWGW